jgi:hypothetical protein
MENKDRACNTHGRYKTIILKLILNKQGDVVDIGFILLKILTSTVLLKTT